MEYCTSGLLVAAWLRVIWTDEAAFQVGDVIGNTWITRLPNEFDAKWTSVIVWDQLLEAIRPDLTLPGSQLSGAISLVKSMLAISCNMPWARSEKHTLSPLPPLTEPEFLKQYRLIGQPHHLI